MRLRYAFMCLLLCSPAVLKADDKPIEFVKNKGQWEGHFQYKATTKNSDIYLEPTGFTYAISDPANADKIYKCKHGLLQAPQTLNFHAYKVQFEGANSSATIEEQKPQAHYYNYFLGNDPAKWATELHPYLAIDYKDIYSNIDLHVSSENAHLKYDFIVRAGGDAENIKLKYTGAENIKLKNNNLQIVTSVGTVEELKPYAYQYVNGQRKEVTCLYKLRGTTISYYFPNGYDKQQMLVIDPTVVFSTYSGSQGDNWGTSATFDAQGNFYAGGTINGTTGTYPVTPGAFQTTFGGGSGGPNNAHPCDMSITKFNAAGNAQMYSTYLGGALIDMPNSLIVDANNNLIISGCTYSTNFPVTAGSYDNTANGGADLVVVKMNAAGTALLGSTYLGGSNDDGVNFSGNWTTYGPTKFNYGDDARSEVIVDNNGNVYLAAPTQSTNFPVTPGTFQASNAGQQDGIIVKLNPSLTALTWSTYIGGNNDDAAYSLALNNSQSALFVGGGTASINFPSAVPSTGLWPGYQGGTADGFILKFQNFGSHLLTNSTFIGRSLYDQCYGIQVDKEDRVYAMGQTTGGAFPVTSGVYSNPNSSQFLIKLDSNLGSNIYSTVFGSGDPARPNISPVAFLVDTCENVYISGWGGILSGGGQGSTTGMAVTGTAVQPTTDGSDFYFIVFAKDAVALSYATFYGGNGLGDHVDGGTSRFNKNGVVYQAICAGCGGSNAFPTTPGSWSPTNGSTNCNLGAVKISFDLSAVDANFTVLPDTNICVGETVSFVNQSSNATNYVWNFGDGSPISTQTSPSHTYNVGGTFKVMLAAGNPNACIEDDTAWLTMHVDTSTIKANFTYQIVDSCDPFSVTFTNTSKYSRPNPVFQWAFGDGTTYTGASPGLHNYPTAGTYTVHLTMIDPLACNSPDTISKTLVISNNFVNAEFEAPDVCQGEPVVFINKSSGATSHLWHFGDGQTSTDISPTHTYGPAGTYTVMLVVSNPKSCNGVDTFTMTIKNKKLPKADFTFEPLIPEMNKPITFTNRSIDAATYDWGFGDGTGSTAENPPPHMYKRTGQYRVCLMVRSADGCPDSMCKTVSADIRPLLDVPTAFSPNGDGVNDILFVEGAAIATLDFKIFNRWGEVVFQTDDIKKGWDGKLRGKEQEMEVYAYTLYVTFIDDSSTSKQGNITLLR